MSDLIDFDYPVRQTGRYEESTAAGERVAAFIPSPLPPQPGLVMPVESRLFYHYSDTSIRLSRMDALLAEDTEPLQA
ncbi:MAG: hypothetical protein ORO03_02845 [Alphaproteobacteria bacterium]|nr:hypothetical protein [Alphaproteobacteria bacterium]